MMSTATQAKVLPVVNLGVAIVFPFVTMVVGWLCNTVVDNTTAIAAMQANRYTTTDARVDQKAVYASFLTMQQEIDARFAKVNDLLHSIDKKIPVEIPPVWFQKEVESLKTQVEQLRLEIRKKGT